MTTRDTEPEATLTPEESVTTSAAHRLGGGIPAAVNPPGVCPAGTWPALSWYTNGSYGFVAWMCTNFQPATQCQVLYSTPFGPMTCLDNLLTGAVACDRPIAGWYPIVGFVCL